MKAGENYFKGLLIPESHLVLKRPGTIFKVYGVPGKRYHGMGDITHKPFSETAPNVVSLGMVVMVSWKKFYYRGRLYENWEHLN